MRSKSPIGGEQEVLGDLLGDRGGALDALGALQEHVAGADDALGVEPPMGVEVLVLGRDERVLDELRDRGRRQVEAAFVRIFREQASVGSVHPRHDGGLVVLELGVVGKVLLELEDHRPDYGGGYDEDNGAGREYETYKPGDGAHAQIQTLRAVSSSVGGAPRGRAPGSLSRIEGGVRRSSPRLVATGSFSPDCGKTMN